MKMWFTRVAAMAAAFALLTVFSAGAADNPDIETIMKKVNAKKGGLHAALMSDLKAGTVDWDAASKKSKEYYDLVSSLGKNDPPKGDKKSWEKLTKDYTDNAKALADACGKKDKSGATGALGKISNSCMTCHRAHRG